MPPLCHHYDTIMPPWQLFRCPSLSFFSFLLPLDLFFLGRSGVRQEIHHGWNMVKKQLNPMCIFPITRMFRKCSSHLWIVNFFGLKRKVRPQFRRGISLLDFNLTRSQSLFRGENPHVWTKQSNLFPLIKYYGIIIWYYGYYTYIILLLDNPIYYPIPFWLSGKSRLILAG